MRDVRNEKNLNIKAKATSGPAGELAKLKTTANHTLIETETLLEFSGSSDIFDIDFSVNENLIFLLQYNGLYRLKVNSEFSKILSTELIIDAFNSNSLAYDWIYHLLYITIQSEIHVIKTSDSKIRYIINANTTGNNIRLAVNPIQKFILWTNEAQIIKANHDGSDSKLLYKSDDEINYVIIDYESNSICLASGGKIILTDYFGNTRISFDTTFNRVGAIAVYSDLIFFETISLIHSLNRNLNNSVSVLKYSVRKFRLIHSSTQPNDTNVCLKSKCSHFCFPLPNNTHRCACPHKTFSNAVLCQQNTNIYDDIMVLFWNFNGVSVINLNSFLNNEVENSMVLFAHNKRVIVDLYYSIGSNLVLWSVADNLIQRLKNNTLYVAPFNTTRNNFLQLNDSQILIDKCDSVLGYDWIHDLVYIDLNNTIVVFGINRPHIQYEIAKISEGKNPISLAVNPIDSKLFWCESNKFLTTPKGVIVRANQDGSNRLEIIDHRFISKPLSLTIDYYSQRLLWFDNNVIQSSDFFGQKFQVLFRQKIYRISSINVFERYLYFIGINSNLMRYTINEAMSNNDKSIVEIPLNSLEPRVFKIIDSSQQPINTINRCLKSVCTHLCLPLSISQYRCVCPTNQKFLSEKCIEKIANITATDNTKPLQSTQNANSLQTFMIIIAILIALVIFLITIIVYRYFINKAVEAKNGDEMPQKSVENIYDEISDEKFTYEAINYDDLNCAEKYEEIPSSSQTYSPFTQIPAPDGVNGDGYEINESEYIQMNTSKL